MPSPLVEPAPNPEIVTTTGARRLAHVAGAAPAAPTESPAQAPAIDQLLKRMQSGDRAAAAEFLMRYESRIRRRVRGKIGADIRRIFDSLDIVSTLGRRLDVYVMSGRLKVGSEGECLSLLFRIADRALIDKARIVRQLENVEGEDSEFAHQIAGRLRDAERHNRSGMDVEIERCINALSDPQDKRILSLWLTGESHNAIAAYVQLAPTAVRQRWQEIKSRLRERMQPAA
jgi:DNA-directed RNA polymerase specialized sigma24 family protein